MKLITIILSALNEGKILEKNLEAICTTLQQLENRYNWEIVLINDGSTDDTGKIGEEFSKKDQRIRVYHHKINLGLGKSLQEAFMHSKGDIVIVLDADLSCSTDHIPKLLDKIEETKASIVIASPQAKGGKMTNVPLHRKALSKMANTLLSSFAKSDITNFTCMVRAYNGDFIRSLNLRSEGMDIMPEIIYKAMILNEPIAEIPAHLNWHWHKNSTVSRTSSMRIFSHTLATLFNGFLLRPFSFIILPGLLLLLFSLYPNTWMFLHFFEEYSKTTQGTFLDRSSEALAIAYQLHPHTFLVGLLSLLLSLQLIATGFLSLQNKHYFEELFSLGTKLRKRQDEDV